MHFSPYYKGGGYCFSIYFAAFPRLKNGPAVGAAGRHRVARRHPTGERDLFGL